MVDILSLLSGDVAKKLDEVLPLIRDLVDALNRHTVAMEKHSASLESK